MISRIIRNTLYSFPLQLLLLLFREHLLLTVLWIALFGFVGEFFGGHYGIPYLYLDPEYNGAVNFYSFLIIGVAIGGFIMSWHVMFYMLNSFRFHFLASLTRPFTVFCFNNSLIPGLFILFYCYQIWNFRSGLGEPFYPETATMISGFLAGVLLVIIIITIYFILFNTNIARFLEKLTDKAREGYINRDVQLNQLKADMLVDKDQWPVESYFAGPFRLRLARDVSHYDPRLVMRVLRQNHKNGFVIVFTSIMLLILLSNTIDMPEFRIPAAASVTIFFILMMVLAGAVSYWFRSWRTLFLVGIIVALNSISGSQDYLYKNKLFGIDYESGRIGYNDAVIDSLTAKTFVEADLAGTQRILKKWRYKIVRDYGDATPPIIFVNVSGGGSKSAYWTMHVLQQLHEEFGDKFMRHTVLMTGASGGMMGMAYYRELYHQQVRGEYVDITNRLYLEDVGKDLLNVVTYSIVANDIFFPFRKYYYQGKVYNKDRGYLFERQFNENTNFQLDKPVMDYKSAEENAYIPMLILAPTIINDHRMLLISPQDVSYLAMPTLRRQDNMDGSLEPDALEFMRWLADYDARDVAMTSALRMNASFPYILPSVHLPSEPATRVLDAGIRDNYGMHLSTRFYSAFKDWIEYNCGEAVFIQIRTDNLKSDLEKANRTSFLQDIFKPVGSIYENFMFEQDYTGNQFLECLDHGLANIHKVTFTYKPSLRNEEASMSLHLTAQEKEDVVQAYHLESNQRALDYLRDILSK